MGKRELVALLSLSSCFPVIVVFLFEVPWVCLQFVIVVFPDHTRLLFFGIENLLKVIIFYVLRRLYNRFIETYIY